MTDSPRDGYIIVQFGLGDPNTFSAKFEDLPDNKVLVTFGKHADPSKLQQYDIQGYDIKTFKERK